MIGCKMLARAPTRLASLTMLSTTSSGLQMAATMMSRPWITLAVWCPPLLVLVNSPCRLLLLLLCCPMDITGAACSAVLTVGWSVAGVSAVTFARTLECTVGRFCHGHGVPKFRVLCGSANAFVRMQAGAGPLESRIPANLRANFSRQYLSQKVDGGRTRADVSP